MRIAALHNRAGITYIQSWEVQQETGPWVFSRTLCPAPGKHQANYRAALAIFNAMSPSDRADIGIKPADFPRLAREMSRSLTAHVRGNGSVR